MDLSRREGEGYKEPFITIAANGLSKLEKGRFFSKIICRNIASVFFGAGSDNRACLAARPETRGYFKKLTVEGVLWVCGMIHHAISEFECGKHVQMKYTSSVIRSMYGL
jgi:hypothetical protein